MIKYLRNGSVVKILFISIWVNMKNILYIDICSTDHASISAEQIKRELALQNGVGLVIGLYKKMSLRFPPHFAIIINLYQR